LRETAGIVASSSKANPEGRLGKVLEQAAVKADEVTALNKIRNVLRSDNPDAAREIGW
jgi:hypothetical protein